MKLSDILRWKQRLDSIDFTLIEQVAKRQLTQLTELADDGCPFDFIDLHTKVDNLVASSNLERELSIPQADFEQKIRELETQYLSLSYRNQWLDRQRDLHELRELRQQDIDQETAKYISAIINANIDWRFPVLELYPSGIWTKNLVAGDPLYIVDVEDYFIENATKDFNKQYKQRLCPYLIAREEPTLDHLPQNQFGFIFSWNAFEYLPYANIVLMIRELFKVTAPGGKVLVSYNNCEKPESCRLVEENFRCYFTRELMQMIATGNGFDVLNFFEPSDNSSLVLLQKPGTLNSPKLQQTLGKLND